jgi:hypothetical protein
MTALDAAKQVLLVGGLECTLMKECEPLATSICVDHAMYLLARRHSCKN